MLKETIDADIKTAMLAKDNVKKEILKFIKSEIQRNEGGLKVLQDVEIHTLMRRQIENLKITPSATSAEEIKILESYVPQMWTEEQIKIEATSFVTGAGKPVTLGEVMKHFSTNHKGLVDNSIVSKVARELVTA